MRAIPLFRVCGECVIWFNSNDDYIIERIKGEKEILLKGYKNVFLVEGSRVVDLVDLNGVIDEEMETFEEEPLQELVREERVNSLDMMGSMFQNLLKNETGLKKMG